MQAHTAEKKEKKDKKEKQQKRDKKQKRRKESECASQLSRGILSTLGQLRSHIVAVQTRKPLHKRSMEG